MPEQSETGSVLTLAVAPLRPGEQFISRPARIAFAVSAPPEDCPLDYVAGDPRWTVRVSAFDYRPATALINALQDARVGGTTLPEFLSYGHVSLWQFWGFYLWWECFRVVELLPVVVEIVREAKPSAVRALPVPDTTDALWQGLVQAVCEHQGVPFLGGVSAGPYWLRLMAALRLRLTGSRPLGTASRQVPPSPLAAPASSRRDGKTMLFVTQGRRHWATVPGKPDGRYDEQCYPLLPALGARGWERFVLVDCDDLPADELARRSEQGEYNLDWRGWSSYADDPAVRRARRRARRHFRSLWPMLRYAPDFDRDFRFQGVRLMPALAQKIQHDFAHELPRAAQMLAAAGRILDRERPDAVIATYEAGPWARAVIIQANRAGIPTVGLQHGMIFDNHHDYMHAAVTTDSTCDPFAFVVPNVTCVWGAFWKRVLTEAGSYPPEAVAVTGHWRYDQVLNAAGHTDRDALRRDFGLPLGKRVILILSAGQDVPGFVRACLASLARRSDCVPFVKLHPDDDPVPVQQALAECAVPPDALIQGRLAEALLACDLVISQPSTVVAEAALLDRPIVMANFGHLSGMERYLEAGICLPAMDPAHLDTAMTQALDDPRTGEQLRVARERFVADFFYRADGCAAVRVAEVVDAQVRGHEAEFV